MSVVPPHELEARRYARLLAGQPGDQEFIRAAMEQAARFAADRNEAGPWDDDSGSGP